MLKRASRDTYNAYMWLQSNRDTIDWKGHIYGPLALEVNVESPLHAKYLLSAPTTPSHVPMLILTYYSRYLEQLTPSWLMTAFVCEEGWAPSPSYASYKETNFYIECSLPISSSGGQRQIPG